MPERRTVALVTLGCARNEVDSEELAGRLEADGWELVADAADAAAPVQLTPSQQASVLVTSSFQIATVEFSPTFDISSIVLNASSKQVAVQLAGAGSIDTAPMFEIGNLQLGPSGEISIMQLSLLGQGPRRG